MKPILYFVRKEFLQFRRDPKMLAMILVAPIVQLILLGYAANFDVEIVHTAVFDQDKSETSRLFIEKFRSSGYFAVDNYVENYNQLQKLVDGADVILGIVIPDNFQNKINRNEQATVQAIFDASDGNNASISAGYVQAVISDYSQKILIERMTLSGKGVKSYLPIQAEIRVWYNPELKTRNFMVPGIVGLLLMLITLILTSLAVVKEKEIGTLEQLIVTPIKPYQLILGKLIPFAILGFIAVILVLTAMSVVFGISVRGNILFLFFTTFIYILSTLGLGLFVSTISKTQQQAMMLAIFTIMLPMVFLSGFTFPIENMPEAIQYVTYLIPLRYFMTIIRGIILKGTGPADLWIESLMMLIIGFTILVLSAYRLRKTLG